MAVPIAPLTSYRVPAWPTLQARRLGRLAWPLLLPMALLLCWWFSSSAGWLTSQVLPAPEFVLDSGRDMIASGLLQEHVWISLQRVLFGFLLGSAIGLVLGGAMGLSERCSDYFYPLLRLVAYVPLLGWLPLLMVLFGIGETLKIVLVAQAALLPVALNTSSAIRAVPRRLLEVAQVYGFSRGQTLWRVILPAAFPSVWSSIRYALTKSWLALVVVELLASSEGLGFLMVDSRALYQLDVMLVAVAAIGVIGYLLDLLLALVERHILRWRRSGFD
ncbi:ABC transporter permease [Pseudomonas sp. ABC1]|uniref:ABC transporter permease n=1 Tax=Pseudomonas sp. ABC1 TaxID=2748080 RepID=UPI0015C3328D|nr:ABC transporter permease [Pseudomonas sp. ABC1]QLF93980.1 ABC transporter permease [Pseudomonas sp. ABC1]